MESHRRRCALCVSLCARRLLGSVSSQARWTARVLADAVPQYDAWSGLIAGWRRRGPGKEQVGADCLSVFNLTSVSSRRHPFHMYRPCVDLV